MNYRHAFHAGNFADCAKHALLLWMLDALQRKPAPFFVLDTHAGIGRYDLIAGDAARTGEWRDGIARLLHEPPPPLRRYVEAVSAIGGRRGVHLPGLADADLPGDARRPTGWPAASCTRRTPRRCARLFRGEGQAGVHLRDGYEAVRALLPPKERRGLVLIDPPYEAPGEFERVVAALQDGAARFDTGVYAAWYPIKHRAPVTTFHEAVGLAGLRDVVAAELWLRRPLDPAVLNGCGLLVRNAPFGFEAAAARSWRRWPTGSAAPRAAARCCGSPMNSVAIMGAGAWGCALARQAARAGSSVTLWARDPARVRDPSLTATAGLPGPGHDAILLAVPLQHLRGLLAQFRPSAPVVICSKGIEARRGCCRSRSSSPFIPARRAPCSPGRTSPARWRPGCRRRPWSRRATRRCGPRIIGALASASFRLYGNDDPVGAQLGGAAKNVIAIAAGVVAGAGLGENARAALITRGLAELTRCVTALGGRAETVSGLSGLGDLLLTCTGASSRNYRCGMALGRGETLDAALAASPGVVEGVATAPALLARAAGVDLPICAAVADLLAGRSTVQGAVAALLNRPMRDE